MLLRKGDTIALPPGAPHSFRVVGSEVLRLLGTHVSPRRIVNYRDGGPTDVRGYRVAESSRASGAGDDSGDRAASKP